MRDDFDDRPTTETTLDAGICLLHVDDDRDFLEMAAAFLEREPHPLDVASVTCAGDALDRLATDDVDCVVSDYDMPDRDGLALLDAVRDRDPDLPFILFTGKGSEEIASEAISRGVTDYLQKGSETEQFTVLSNRVVNAVRSYRSRRALEHRENRLARAQRIANLGNWDWDVQADTLRWSTQIYRIFGVDPDEFEATYEAFLEFVHPDDRDRVSRAVEVALDGRDSYDLEHRVVRPDGETRIVHEQGEVVRDDDGDPTLMTGTVQDVTDRVERRRDLKVFREAVEHAGHVIYWTNPDGVIQYVNPAFEETTGYSRAEAVGATPRILKSGVHDESVYAEMWETITAGETWESDLVNRRKDGTLYVVHQTIAPVTNDRGDIVRFVAVNAPRSQQSVAGWPTAASDARLDGVDDPDS